MLGSEKRETSGFIDISSNITDFKSLLKIGHIIGPMKSNMTQTLLQTIFEKSCPVYQKFGIAMIVPISFAPLPIYTILHENVNQFDSIPEELKAGFALRLARSAAMCNKGQQLLKENILQTLLGKSVETYSLAYLYLCAQLQEPTDFEPQLSTDIRTNAMTLYYLAINRMLLNRFEDAEQALQRAFVLTKGCKDFRPNVIEKLSLASFLNHTPYSVFLSFLPEKYYPQAGSQALIWDLNAKIDSSVLNSYYSFFTSAIIQEHTRRIILDYSLTVEKIPIKMLQTQCNVDSIETYIAQMQSLGEIDAKIVSHNVIFNGPVISDKIKTQVANVSDLLARVQAQLA